MNPDFENDTQVDENLRALAGGARLPAGPSPEVLERCTAALSQARAPARWRTRGRRVLITALGAAASIALLVGFFYQPGGEESAVAAAIILQKLEDQIQTSPRLDIKINGLAFDDASLDGWIQISRKAVAGDFRATVREDEDAEPIEVDVAMGLSAETGWVLVRRLTVPDLKARVMLAFLFPAGAHTLLKLPPEELRLAFEAGPGEIGWDRITAFVQELIESREEMGATLIEQSDGTLLLTLPIRGEDTLNALRELHVRGFSLGFGMADQADKGEQAEASEPGSSDASDPSAEAQESGGAAETIRRFHARHGIHHEFKVGSTPPQADGEQGVKAVAKFHLDVHGPDFHRPLRRLHGPEELIGATIKIVYDPSAEQVRSITIENLGTQQGSISLKIGEGEIDAELLDSSRLTDENTRILDLAALEKILGGFHTGEAESPGDQ